MNEGTSHAPTHWRVVPAIAGRGELLVGPDDHRDAALVFAPPDVLMRGTEDLEGLTRSGWRLALWGKNEHGDVLIDQGRPDYLEEVGLAAVVREVSRRCPEQLAWIATVVERHLRFLLATMRPDAHGRRYPGWEAAHDELRSLQEEADAAFAEAAAGLPEARGWWATPKPFMNLWLAYTAQMDAAQWDARRLGGEGSPPASVHRLDDVRPNPEADGRPHWNDEKRQAAE